MGFFGEIVTEKKREIIIPDAYSLCLTQSCIDFGNVDESKARSQLFVQTAFEDDEFRLCHLSQGVPQCPLNHEFGPEDSPLTVWSVGCTIHLTGRWKWELDEEEEGGECEGDEEEDKSESAEDLVCHEVAPVVAPTKREKRKIDNLTQKISQNEVSAAQPATNNIAVESSTVPAKKQKAKKQSNTKLNNEIKHLSEPNAIVAKPPSDSGSQRKRWKVKPQNEEGTLVPEPQQLAKTCGVLITDHVIGKGKEPVNGSKIGIIYEGMYPNGVIFDSRSTRSSPLVFRKGVADVVRGLDLGLEGMRIGGSREIVIPSELGYGSKGCGDIPPNQVLVFRVTLLDADKKKSK